MVSPEYSVACTEKLQAWLTIWAKIFQLIQFIEYSKQFQEFTPGI